MIVTQRIRNCSLKAPSVGFSICVAISIFSIAHADTPLETKEETEHVEIGDRSPTEADRGSSDSGLPDKTESDLADADIDLLGDLDIPVVVTATRGLRKLSDLPYAVSVITSDDIRRAGSRSVPDALRLAAGVDVAELSYGNYAVSPRGFHDFNANKTLVLVDGRQIFDTQFNGTFWSAWPFQLDDIERIEVLRGPGGVTWGANAVNGVINIITKDPSDQLGFSATFSGGSRGAHREHYSYGFERDRLRMRLSAELEGSDGFKDGNTFPGNLDDEFEAIRIGLHGIYDSGPDDTLMFSLGSAIVDGNWPLPFTGRFDNLQPDTQSAFLLGKWAHRVSEENNVELQTYVNHFHAHGGAKWADYHYQQIGINFNQTVSLLADHTITWGVDGRWDFTDASNADPFMLSRDKVRAGAVGIYVQDDWTISPKWSLNIGGRIDYDSYGGFEPSGRAALSYRLSDTSFVYGAVSRAYRLPSAAFRFLDYPLVGEFVRVTSRRGVEREGLFAYELGYRGRLFEPMEFSAIAFWNHYRDLITRESILGPPGFISIFNDNQDSLSLYGVELECQLPLSDQLRMTGTYTFQNVDSRTSLIEAGSISPPRHKFMVGCDYDATDNLRFSSRLYFADGVRAPDGDNANVAKYIDPYFRLDLRAEHEFWDDKAAIAVGVRNLLDNNHPEGGATSLDNADVPRMVYAELRLSAQ
jgi:iron complex outermembrane receptor protein